MSDTAITDASGNALTDSNGNVLIIPGPPEPPAQIVTGAQYRPLNAFIRRTTVYKRR